MGKITFILGGAGSGKSSLATKFAQKKGGRVAFIATCKPMDREMEKRVMVHKAARPKAWQTYEEGGDLSPLLKKSGNKFDCIIIDCLTLLVSNLLLKGFTQKKIESIIIQMCLSLKKLKAETIIVSNEVGLGIVPENKLARKFRDIAGRVNQIVAAESDEAFFIVAGIPVKLPMIY